MRGTLRPGLEVEGIVNVAAIEASDGGSEAEGRFFLHKGYK